MKRIFAFLVTAFLISQPGFSQNLWGIKAGPSITNITRQGYPDGENSKAGNRIGYQLGAFVQRDIGEKMFMRTELAYAVKGYTSTESSSGTKGKTGYNYINLPLLLGYKINPKLAAFLGPEISALGNVYASSRSNKQRTRMNNTVDYEKLDVGATAGVLYHLTAKISLDLRYVYGFSKILIMDFTDENGHNVGQASEKNNKALQLSINYFFRDRT